MNQKILLCLAVGIGGIVAAAFIACFVLIIFTMNSLEYLQ